MGFIRLTDAAICAQPEQSTELNRAGKELLKSDPEASKVALYPGEPPPAGSAATRIHPETGAAA